jgi:hypothetical protein
VIDQDLIALIDQRIRAAQQMTRAAGTCVDRATTGPDANVIFDGSTVAMPVKVLGSVFLQNGDRCVLEKFGSNWVVTGSWAAVGLGGASLNQACQTPGISTTSSTYSDVSQISGFTFTKLFDETFVRIGMTTSCFSTATSTRARFAMLLTPDDSSSTYVPTDYATTQMHFNVANQHMSAYGLTRRFDIPAGTYTCQTRWRRISGTGSISADDADLFHLEVDEQVSQSARFL